MLISRGTCIAVFAILSAASLSCHSSGDSRPVAASGILGDTSTSTDGGTTTTTTSTTTTSTTTTTTTATTTDQKVVPTGIVAATPTVNTLFTKGNAGTTCADVVFTVNSAAGVAAGVDVAFSVSSAQNVTDPGSVNAAKATTDAKGDVTATYCSGADATTVNIVATVGTLSANSGDITVVAKDNFLFQYGNVGLAELNLFDSGPNDCTNVLFSLTNNAKPVIGVTQRFTTQLNYPKAAKLAEKPATGKTAVDAATGAPYGYYDAVSDSAGTFTVPLCAGTALGTVVISGTYKTSEGALMPAQSPPIQITTGLASWSNISITFDPTDARIVKGYLETNTTESHNFTVKVNAQQDGKPLNNPVTVISEIGEITYPNGQLPDSHGNVAFTLMPLHLSDYRPYLVHTYNSTAADDSCKVEDLVTYANSINTSNPLTPKKIVKYSDLAMNWRIAVTYMMRGQESFHDTKRTGIFDATNAIGFWDKKQSGVYDASGPIPDVITTLAPLNDWSSKDPTADWFFDLPTPFVDVDKNGDYTSGVDILFGDQYVLPNRKRDNDTMIWKSFLAPIYLGTSPFAMRHAAIGASVNLDDTNAAQQIGSSYIFGLGNAGLGGSVNPKLLGSSSLFSALGNVGVGNVGLGIPDGLGALVEGYFFAHDICGNPMPGGTKISSTVEITSTATVGPRNVLTHFYMQPGDGVLEPARRLLKDATGGSSATINYNITDHRSSPASYPIEMYIEVAPCTNLCTGDVVSGVYCDAFAGNIYVTADTDTIAQTFSIPTVDSCVCQTHAIPKPGSCACPSGTIGNGAACVCPIGQVYTNGACACPSGTWNGSACQ